MAGAVAITWLAEAASTGAVHRRDSGGGIGSETDSLYRDCRAAVHARSRRNCVVCVEDTPVVAVVGTAVAAVVEDAQAKRRAGLQRGVEPRHAEIRAVEGQAGVCGRGKRGRVRQRPHTDNRLRLCQRSGFQFIERRHLY